MLKSCPPVAAVRLPDRRRSCSLAAVAVILAALAFEHIGGYTPCPLCLQQRYAYYAAIPALLAALVLSRSAGQASAAVIFAPVAVAFLVNAATGHLSGRCRMEVLGTAGLLRRPGDLPQLELEQGNLT